MGDLQAIESVHEGHCKTLVSSSLLSLPVVMAHGTASFNIYSSLHVLPHCYPKSNVFINYGLKPQKNCEPQEAFLYLNRFYQLLC